MSRRTGTVVAAIALWLVIVASTSTVAWFAIDRAGRGAYLSEGARPELTQSGPRPTRDATTVGTTSAPSATTTRPTPPRPSRTAQATTPATTSAPTSATTSPPTSPRPSTATPRTSPRATTSGPRSSASSSSAPRPPAVEDSTSVTGGSVGVSCRGTTLTLRFATPRNGWSYTIERSTSTVEVSFRRTGGEGESEVHASCSAGAPVFETSSSDGGDGEGADG